VQCTKVHLTDDLILRLCVPPRETRASFPRQVLFLQLRPTAGEPAWSSQVARRGEATATKKSGTTAKQGEATGCGATRTS
jgi:hypothetical protein